MKIWKFSLVLLVLLLSFVNMVQVNASIQYKYGIKLEFENRGDEPLDMESFNISIPLFKNTPWQTVFVDSSTHELITKFMDDDGNQWAEMGIQRYLSAGESITFNVTYIIDSKKQLKPDIELSIAEKPELIPNDLIQKYTFSTETFLIDNAKISSLTKKLTENEQTVLDKVVRLISWFKENITYYNYEIPHYPTETLVEGLGDCDDQAILFITMCRSIGIPAFLQVGILVDSKIVDDQNSLEGHFTSSQNGLGWHGWVMIYVPPWGWIPVDLTFTELEGLNILREAPEYNENIILAMNISKQAYVGDTLENSERIINSTLYIFRTDEVQIITQDPFWVNQGIVVLGITVLISIVLMIRSDIRII